MKKFFNWIKNWSAVIILAAFIACMVCAFICCLACKGNIYPVFGGVATACTIAISTFQLGVEIKNKGGL